MKTITSDMFGQNDDFLDEEIRRFESALDHTKDYIQQILMKLNNIKSSEGSRRLSYERLLPQFEFELGQINMYLGGYLQR